MGVGRRWRTAIPTSRGLESLSCRTCAGAGIELAAYHLHVRAMPLDFPRSSADSDASLHDAVERGSPADDAGVAPGDVIISLDETPISDIDTLQRLLAADASARTLPLVVVRRNRVLTLPVTPRESPAGAR